MIRSWLPHPIYCGFLALGWMILNERYSIGEFLIGYTVGAIIVRSLGDFWPGPLRIQHPGRFFRLALEFTKAIIVANLSVAWTVIRPRLDIHPAFVIVPLDLDDDLRITALANMITLTPGTLSVDVAPDRSALYVHCLDVDDADVLRASIKDTFERGIEESLL